MCHNMDKTARPGLEAGACQCYAEDVWHATIFRPSLSFFSFSSIVYAQKLLPSSQQANSYFSLLALLRLRVISRNRSGRRWSTGGQSVPGSLRSARPSLQKAIRVSLTPPHLTTLPPPANDHTSILSPYKHTHTLPSCVQFLYINAHPPISIPFISLFIPLRCIAISQEAITLPYYTLSVSHH
jgi:hypothetical protein